MSFTHYLDMSSNHVLLVVCTIAHACILFTATGRMHLSPCIRATVRKSNTSTPYC